MKYLIIYGNLADGVWFEGPYESLDSARGNASNFEHHTVEFLHSPGTSSNIPISLGVLADCSQTILAELIHRWPGLVNGVDAVSVADLAQFLTNSLTAIRDQNRPFHRRMQVTEWQKSLQQSTDLEFTGELAAHFIQYAKKNFVHPGLVEIDGPTEDMKANLKKVFASGNLEKIHEEGGLFVQAWVWVEINDLSDDVREKHFGRFDSHQPET